MMFSNVPISISPKCCDTLVKKFKNRLTNKCNWFLCHTSTVNKSEVEDAWGVGTPEWSVSLLDWLTVRTVINGTVLSVMKEMYLNAKIITAKKTADLNENWRVLFLLQAANFVLPVHTGSCPCSESPAGPLQLLWQWQLRLQPLQQQRQLQQQQQVV